MNRRKFMKFIPVLPASAVALSSSLPVLPSIPELRGEVIDIEERKNLTVQHTVFHKPVTFNIHGIAVPQDHNERVKLAVALIDNADIVLQRPIMIINNVINQNGAPFIREIDG